MNDKGNLTRDPARLGEGVSRIAILLSTLRGAGIQRMRLNIARHLVSLGYPVDLVLAKATGDLADQVPTGAIIHELAARSRWQFPVNLWRYFRDRKPTHVLSAYEDISILSLIMNALSRHRFFLLISSHTSLRHLRDDCSPVRLPFNWFRHLLIARLYSGADALVAVSAGLADEVSRVAGVPRKKVQVIYNPVIGPSQRERFDEPSSLDLSEDGSRPVVAFFGRLHSQKRVDLLISAFEILAGDPAPVLLIAGDGPERPKLQRLVAEKALSERVHFAGFVQNPIAAMRLCTVVVLPSDYEGLGNVLVEAMFAGTQVVATDCPYGPREILGNDEFGRLVPTGDVPALRDAISDVIHHRFFVAPERLQRRAMEFSADRAVAQYLRALGIPARPGHELPQSASPRNAA